MKPLTMSLFMNDSRHASAGPISLPAVSGTLYSLYSNKRVGAWAGACIQGATTATAGGGSTMDIGFDSNNNLSAAALTSNSAIAVNKSYDQSGNGRDLTNNGTNPRPYVTASQTAYPVIPIQFGGIDNVSPPEQNLQTVNTLSIDRRNMTMYMVLNPRVSIATSSWFEYRTAGARQLTGVVYNGQNGFYTADQGLGLNVTGQRPRAQPIFLAITSSASGMSIYINEQKFDFAAYSAVTIDQLVLGLSGIGGGWGFKGDMFFHATYTGVHSQSEVLSMRAALAPAFNVPLSFTSRVVFVGDSITQGIGTMRNLIDQLGLAGAELFNLGIAGETAAGAYTSRASREGGQGRREAVIN